MSAAEWSVIALSLRVGVCCVLVSLPPALLVGWLLEGDFRRMS